MKTSRYARAFLAALITLAITGSVSIARADIKDYEFQLIDQTIKKGDAIISVRLVHKPDGKPVPDAVIFATRLDMAPDGMQEGWRPGSRRCRAQSPASTGSRRLSPCRGRWQLSLGAKVQGETGTVEKQACPDGATMNRPGPRNPRRRGSSRRRSVAMLSTRRPGFHVGAVMDTSGRARHAGGDLLSGS